MNAGKDDLEKSRIIIVKRAIRAYLASTGIIALAVIISVTHGAGWKPALACTPLYITMFAGITYQLVKELRALKEDNSDLKPRSDVRER